jgi:hypothetical protein
VLTVEQRWYDGDTHWTLTRDMGHGCETGVGGPGVPTQQDIDRAVERIKHTTEGRLWPDR